MLLVTLPVDMQQLLVAALAKAGSKECGGVLLGEHTGFNQFAVRSVTVQKPGAVASFMRGMSGVLSAIQRYCRSKGNDYRRFNYLGEWHSHPLFSVAPSSRDHSTMVELATDHRVGANFVVLLIVRLVGGKLEGSVHTYLPDGSVHPSTLELEPEP